MPDYRIAIVTVSDRGAAGLRDDLSGPAVRERIAGLGTILAECLVPDEQDRIAALLCDLADRQSADLILTTGGTGLSPRDVTPEATLAVVGRLVPGHPRGNPGRQPGRYQPRHALPRRCRYSRPNLDHQPAGQSARGARMPGCGRTGAGPRAGDPDRPGRRMRRRRLTGVRQYLPMSVGIYRRPAGAASLTRQMSCPYTVGRALTLMTFRMISQMKSRRMVIPDA